MNRPWSAQMAFAVVLFGLLAGLCQAPARAADRDWAVAGKVLTGFVALQALDHLFRRDYVSYHRAPAPRYYYGEPEYWHCGPQYGYGYQPYYRVARAPVRWVVVEEDEDAGSWYLPRDRARWHRVEQPAAEVEPVAAAPAPITTTTTGPAATAAETKDAIIVEIEPGKRLYQQRVHGAKAYIQVWSEVQGTWVPLKEYPSLY